MGLYRTIEHTLNGLLAPVNLKLVRDRPMRDMNALMLLKARERGVRTLLDVGANKGQFAAEMRRLGYKGRIVSFEPLSDAHAQLAAAAAGDPEWIVPERMAIGNEDGEARINISANSVSSSLLGVESKVTEVETTTDFVAAETTPLRRLDSALLPEWDGPYAMKIDTQGFEMAVLQGAPETLRQTELVSTELSLARLYTGGARVSDVFAFLEDAGFRAIAVTEGFADAERNEVLQVDATFLRDR